MSFDKEENYPYLFNHFRAIIDFWVKDKI